MQKGTLFTILILAFSALLTNFSCRSNRRYEETGSTFIFELSPGLNRDYLIEKFSQITEIRTSVSNRPANRSKNEWLVTVYHTSSRDFSLWQNSLTNDTGIIRYYQMKTHPDPPGNDTIRGGIKITPKF
ncbi:MAG TPA: hypothetical protein DCX89_05045 [Saprospirales bacterium]|nr:hypothetical protein [Saprospirales bacterium]HRQ29802.1 hypothetical protein [Saprospiraceae bacterium]